jgi:membrane protein YdbS with pleckstrin-like domain
VDVSTHDRLIWQGYPAWSKFAWLYLASFVAGSRVLRILWQGATGWEGWLAGALALLVCAACLRQWAQYLIFSSRVVMRNGYTGRDNQTVALDDIAEITLSQGPIARFLNIGTLEVHSKSGNSPLLLQGVSDPEIIKTRLEACRPNRH